MPTVIGESDTVEGRLSDFPVRCFKRSQNYDDKVNHVTLKNTSVHFMREI